MATSQELSLEVTQSKKESNCLFNLLSLLLSQSRAAQYLEFAYLTIRESPKISQEVRKLIDDYQRKYTETYGLVIEYKGIAKQQVTLFKMIKIGIEQENEEIIKGGITEMLKDFDDIVNKTKETKETFYTIQTAVNAAISDIDKKNADIKTRKSEIASEMQQNKLKVVTVEKVVTNVMAKNKEKEKKVEDLQSKRAKFLEDSVQPNGFFESFKDFLTTGMAIFGCYLRGPEAGKVIFDAVKNANNKNVQSQQNQNASAEIKKDIVEEQNKIVQNEERIERMSTAAFDGLQAMEKLACENENLMIEESLEMAGRELLKVTDLFGQILMFWETMSAHLKTLKTKKLGVESFAKFVRNQSIANMLETEVLEMETEWNSFANWCELYAKVSLNFCTNRNVFTGTQENPITVEEIKLKRQAVIEKYRKEITELVQKFGCS